VLVKA